MLWSIDESDICGDVSEEVNPIDWNACQTCLLSVGYAISKSTRNTSEVTAPFPRTQEQVKVKAANASWCTV